MRKFLVALMVLVMLTPSLACAMPVCAGDTPPASHEMPPCPGHGGVDQLADYDRDVVNNNGLMLLKDCMGIDLQVADKAPAAQKPDMVKDGPYSGMDSGFILSNVDSHTPQIIRGPPPVLLSVLAAQPPVLLTTQRFRI